MQILFPLCLCTFHHSQSTLFCGTLTGVLAVRSVFCSACLYALVFVSWTAVFCCCPVYYWWIAKAKGAFVLFFWNRHCSCCNCFCDDAHCCCWCGVLRTFRIRGERAAGGLVEEVRWYEFNDRREIGSVECGVWSLWIFDFG